MLWTEFGSKLKYQGLHWGEVTKGCATYGFTNFSKSVSYLSQKLPQNSHERGVKAFLWHFEAKNLLSAPSAPSTLKNLYFFIFEPPKCVIYRQFLEPSVNKLFYLSILTPLAYHPYAVHGIYGSGKISKLAWTYSKKLNKLLNNDHRPKCGLEMKHKWNLRVLIKPRKIRVSSEKLHWMKLLTDRNNIIFPYGESLGKIQFPLLAFERKFSTKTN